MAFKLKFLRVRAKNFRSIGQQFIELDLSSSPSTLIVSPDNGHGKSTLAVWAIYYALFGKAYGDKAKKTSLINTRNNKETMVEVEFETKGSHWLVRRGMKPNIFEIIQDGKPLDMAAANKDSQQFLQEILDMDDAIFESTIVLGGDRFVPFVKMAAGDRRHLVEGILDLGVFNIMADVNKEMIGVINNRLIDAKHKVANDNIAINGQQRVIDTINRNKATMVEDIKARIDDLNTQIHHVNKDMGPAQQELEAAKQEYETIMADDPQKRLNQIDGMIDKFRAKADADRRKATNFRSMSSCPTCFQDVSGDMKDAVAGSLENQVKELEDKLPALERMREAAVLNVKKCNDALASLSDAQSAVNKIADSLANMERNKSQLTDMITKAQQNMGDLDAEQAILQKMTATRDEHEAVVDSLNQELAEHQMISVMLRDKGPRQEIINQYIPFFNQSVNRILSAMNMYVGFNMSDTFEVDMLDPTRANQSMHNLSSGQLRRIDLAILLTWREIAKLKNSVDCNLLILDEILESLSEQGVRDFMMMAKSMMGDMNLICITQRESEFDEYFDSKVTCRLVDDFTFMA